MPTLRIPKAGTTMTWPLRLPPYAVPHTLPWFVVSNVCGTCLTCCHTCARARSGVPTRSPATSRTAPAGFRHAAAHPSACIVHGCLPAWICASAAFCLPITVPHHHHSFAIRSCSITTAALPAAGLHDTRRLLPLLTVPRFPPADSVLDYLYRTGLLPCLPYPNRLDGFLFPTFIGLV